MPTKNYVIDGENILIYKRKNSRSLRLSIASSGQIKLSMPYYVPYYEGVKFINSNREWISKHKLKSVKLEDNLLIGKAHRLSFVPSSTATSPKSYIKHNQIVIKYPETSDMYSSEVQKTAYAASEKALRNQATNLLPQRLDVLADKYGFTYKTVKIKKLKGRWGSCDSSKNIVLNLFLMQAPWELIDYVLIHELVHTKVLKHGPEFWEAVGEVLPKYKQLRKQLKEYRPFVHGLNV